MHEAEHEGRENPKDPDRDLELAVQLGGPCRAIGAATEQPRTQPQPAHVRGNDGGN